MGRLKYHSVYLCGPIDRAPDAGVEWRQRITPFLRALGILVLDPTKKCIKSFKEGIRGETKQDVEAINELKANEQWDTVSILTKNIRGVDLRCTDKADFLIVNYDKDIHMAGTAEEIVTANRAKKPILFMCPQGKVNIPNWYFGMLPHEFFFNNWEDLQNYIIDIDQGIKTHKRWVLFDLDSQIEETANGRTK